MHAERYRPIIRLSDSSISSPLELRNKFPYVAYDQDLTMVLFQYRQYDETND